MLYSITIFGWTCFSIYLGLAIISMFSFIAEREWRAAVRGALFFFPLLTLLGTLLYFDFGLQSWFLLSFLCLNGILVFIMLLPFNKARSIQIIGEPGRVDERDALFHRFYRLKPGTSEFEAYYRDHPEKRAFDEKVRSLPNLGEPGSKTYHPLTTPYHEAIFNVLGKSTRNVAGQPDPIEEKPVKVSPAEFTNRVKGFARYLGADLVGITELNPAFVYSHIARGDGEWGAPIELNHRYAIAIAVEMRHDMIRHAPLGPSITESALRYYDNAKIAMIVARYINRLGYEARAHVDGNYRVMCIPIAVAAGLGELGRLGLLITPQYGPRVRLSVVTTDLPLLPGKPIHFGVQHFCTICKKCAVNCPSASIDKGEKQVYNGVEKWLSDQDNCYRYWRIQGTDCALCIKVCPYSYPRAPMHNLIRWIVRRNNLARRLAFTGDRFFYGQNPTPFNRLPGWHLSD